MIDIDTPNRTPGPPSGPPRKPVKDPSDGSLGRWLQQNKVLLCIVAAVVIGLVAFILLRPDESGEEVSRPMATAAAPGTVDLSPKPASPAGDSLETTPASEPSEPSEDVSSPPAAAEPTPTATPSSEEVDPTLLTEESEELGEDYEMSPETGDPDPVAEQFAAAWMNPEGGHAAWLERLRPVVTDFAYEGLQYTAEETIYDQEVSNLEVKTYEPGDVEVPFAIYGDGGAQIAQATMVMMPDGSWKVDHILGPDTLVW